MTSSRKAAGGVFVSGEGVEHEFKYMDLVDMEDGNVWVGTESEPVTVFWPYPEGVTAEDDIAVVRFPGLTRDYTTDADDNEGEENPPAGDDEKNPPAGGDEGNGDGKDNADDLPSTGDTAAVAVGVAAVLAAGSLGTGAALKRRKR